MRAYVYKKKKRSRRFKKRVFFLSVLCVITLLLVYYFKVVTPVVVTLSEEKVRSLSTTVISKSVEEVLSNENIAYSDLVHIERNANNEITLISTDSVKINLLVRDLTERVQVDIDEVGKEGVDIALGTFTGIPFLYGIGPMISVKLVPVGTVNTTFNSSFVSAGINQTLHSLYFVVDVNIGMVLPGYTKNISTKLDVEICESVIVGKVPEFYLQ